MASADAKAINLDFYAPTFEVEINGRELSADVSKAVISVSVTERLRQASRFNLSVNNQSLNWHDHHLFKIGSDIVIKMGYVKDLREMINGKITDVQVTFPASGASTMTVNGLDHLDDVFRSYAKKTYSLSDVTYSEAVQQIAADLNLQSRVDPTADKQAKIVIREGESFQPFFNDIARRLDYRFYVRGKTLHFRKRQPAGEVLTLSWRKNLIQFTPHISLHRQLTQVEVRGYDPKTTEPIVGIATSDDITATESGGQSGSEMLQASGAERVRVITNRPVFSKAEAERIAEAELNKANEDLVSGDGSCLGLPGLRPDDYIVLKELGKRFEGKYHVETVTHTFNNSGYLTNFNVRRNSSHEPA
jgi:phage protein D